MKPELLRIVLVTGIAVLLASAPSAQEYNYFSGNHSWSLSCNSSGYVLQSQFPVTRFQEAGASSKVTHKLETLYLGRSCDASHSVLGEGTWCWANGGFAAEIQGNRLGFPRQGLSCPNEENSLLECRC